MIVEIFGKSICIKSHCNEIYSILERELSLYPVSDKNIEVEINFVEQIKLSGKLLKNPSVHYSFENGFLIFYGSNKVLFQKKNGIIKVEIELSMNKNFLKNSVSKFRSIDFRNNVERVGTFLHELILVPFNYFFTDRAIIHASAIKNPVTGKTILLGGTGGVGKTSLELFLCNQLHFSFISDDIAVVDSTCNVFPNLSYPKIYAYNVVGNLELERVLFEDRSFWDKLQWLFFQKTKLKRAASTLLFSAPPGAITLHRLRHV